MKKNILLIGFDLVHLRGVILESGHKPFDLNTDIKMIGDPSCTVLDAACGSHALQECEFDAIIVGNHIRPKSSGDPCTSTVDIQVIDTVFPEKPIYLFRPPDQFTLIGLEITLDEFLQNI